MNKLPPYGYLLLAAAIIAFGFYYVINRNEKAKKMWPAVPGQIVQSDIIRSTKAYLQTPTVNRTMRDDKSYQYSAVWAFDVEYRYAVDGETHRGTRVTATDHVEAIKDHPDGPTEQMTAWKSQLAPGATVPIHYDPSNPIESYIFFDQSDGLGSVLATGVVLVLLGLALIAAPRIFP